MAFNQTGLTEITLPSTLVKISSNAFYYCYGLKRVNISDLTAWCGVTFEGNDSHPRVNGAELYLNGSRVTDLVIPAGVTSIGDSAFYLCESLTNVVIPNAVATIGSSVESIGTRAFAGIDTILFQGDAPTMDSTVFSDYDHTVYYPNGNAAWTSALADSQQYGDNLTWVPYVAQGTCGDDLTWLLTTDGVLTISGTGDMWNYSYSSD